MFVTEKEFVQICLVTVLTISIYSKYLPQRSSLEFLFYCIPQVLIVRYIKYIDFIFLFFASLLFLIPGKQTKGFIVLPDLIDRSRMRIIFLGCTVFLLSNFNLVSPNNQNLKAENGNKLNLGELVMNSYVFNAGLVSCKASFTRKAMHMFKSLILGVIRLVGDMKTKQQTEKIEYVNTFFILSILNILAMLGLPKYSFVLGILILTIYQIGLICSSLDILTIGTEIINLKNNFKGIILVIPLYSLYLMASGLGYSIIITLKDKRKLGILYIVISLIFYIVFRYFNTPSSTFLSAPYCLLIFIVNTLDIVLFDFFTRMFGMNELEITQFASRIVFHAFLTINVFIPFAKSMKFFETHSESAILLKCFAYLFIIFYGCFKFKKSVFDFHLKSRLEKVPVFSKILNFEIKDKKVEGINT
jgi:glucosaminylphosphatidylinositol acyltransferase